MNYPNGHYHPQNHPAPTNELHPNPNPYPDYYPNNNDPNSYTEYRFTDHMNTNNYDTVVPISPVKPSKPQKKWKGIVSLAVVCSMIAAAIGYFVYMNGVRRAIPSVPAPIQTQTSGGTFFQVDDYAVTINYLYEYELEGLVVHTKDYLGFGIDDKLSPKDLAIAWGTVAENNTKIDFHWNQANRYCSWTPDENTDYTPVGGFTGIGFQFSNNHILPANSDTWWKLKAVRRGDHVKIKGYLVNVDGSKVDGTSFQWHSSTTRTDTGAHACEVIYVTDIIQLP